MLKSMFQKLFLVFGVLFGFGLILFTNLPFKSSFHSSSFVSSLPTFSISLQSNLLGKKSVKLISHEKATSPSIKAFGLENSESLSLQEDKQLIKVLETVTAEEDQESTNKEEYEAFGDNVEITDLAFSKPFLDTSINETLDSSCLSKENSDNDLNKLLSVPAYEETCRWWIDKVSRWRNYINQKSGKKRDNFLYAHQERSGTGDRMAGAQAAFFFAMEKGLKLKMQWTLIDKVFRPSCYISTSSSSSYNRLWNKQKLNDTLESDFELEPFTSNLITFKGSVPKAYFNSCGLTGHYSCSTAERKRMGCDLYNRACMSGNSCLDMAREYSESKINMIHTVGCPTRMLFQPLESFFKHEISWFIDDGFVNGTIKDLLIELKKFKVIAIHLRLGDAFMEPGHMGEEFEAAKELTFMRKAKGCIFAVNDLTAQDLGNTNKVVRKFQAVDSSDKFADDRRIKWLVASDDMRIRNLFQKRYPRKVIILSSKPHHVQKIRRDPELVKELEMLDLFAEWFAISRADILVANRAHNFGVSAFSRSAWLWSLKTKYYEVKLKDEVCRYREFGYEGNLAKVNKPCKGDISERREEQRHLKFYKEVSESTITEAQQLWGLP